MELRLSHDFMKNLIRQMVQVSRSGFGLNSHSSSLSSIFSDQKKQAENVQRENLDTGREALTILEETSSLNKRASLADEASREGRERQKLYLENMEVLSDSISKATSFLEEFTRSAGDISRLTGMILDISSRLDVLSINGAIEAARRGEAGLGFSVITREMKKLSQETAVSADRVRHIIGQFETASTGLQDLFSTSAETLKESRSDAGGIYENFLKIEEQNREMAQQVGRIQELMDSMVQRNENRQISADSILSSVHSSADEINKITGESGDLHNVVRSTLEDIGSIRLDWHDRALESVKTIAEGLKESDESLKETLEAEFEVFPYMELLYLMDEKGVQVEDNAVHPDFRDQIDGGGKGADRSLRPYFSQLESSGGSYISNIYLSTAVNHLCLTISVPCVYNGRPHVLAADMNLEEFVKQ